MSCPNCPNNTWFFEEYGFDLVRGQYYMTNLGGCCAKEVRLIDIKSDYVVVATMDGVEHNVYLNDFVKKTWSVKE